MRIALGVGRGEKELTDFEPLIISDSPDQLLEVAWNL